MILYSGIIWFPEQERTYLTWIIKYIKNENDNKEKLVVPKSKMARKDARDFERKRPNSKVNKDRTKEMGERPDTSKGMPHNVGKEVDSRHRRGTEK